MYDDAERDRIRAVLLNYLTDSGLRQPKLYKAICLAERSTPETVGFSFKTFQRFLARKGRVGDEVVADMRPLRKGIARPIPIPSMHWAKPCTPCSTAPFPLDLTVFTPSPPTIS